MGKMMSLQLDCLFDLLEIGVSNTLADELPISQVSGSLLDQFVSCSSNVTKDDCLLQVHVRSQFKGRTSRIL